MILCIKYLHIIEFRFIFIECLYLTRDPYESISYFSKFKLNLKSKVSLNEVDIGVRAQSRHIQSWGLNTRFTISIKDIRYGVGNSMISGLGLKVWFRYFIEV